MSVKIKHIVMLLALLLGLPTFAVTKPASPPAPPVAPSVIDNVKEGYEDYVEIDIPESVLNQLVIEPKEAPKKNNKPKQQNTVKPGINKIEGYRIQVFSDASNPNSLESRARARGNAIVAKFPKYRGQVYAFSSSPNWYTRIGNFRDQKEASAALAELKRAFPQYAADMRVVKSQITVIK